MKQNEQILLQLIRCSLYGKDVDCCKNTEIDWQKVYEDAEHQTVTGIIAELFSDDQYRISLPLKEMLSTRTARNVMNFHRHLYYQGEVIQALQNHNIRVAVLKGVVAAANYPVPEYRTMGDIDLLIPIEDLESAKECLLQLDYQLTSEENGKINEISEQKHLSFYKDDIILELHVKTFRVPDKKIGDLLNNYMVQGLENIQMITIEGYDIPTLPVLQNALEFSLHVQEHLTGAGIGLRQIIDWSLFAEKHLPDAVYISEIQPLLYEAGLDTFAKTLTRTCQLYLDLPEDNIHWCMDADEQLCEQLMEYVLSQGNFGKKNLNDNGARAFARLGSPIGFLRDIQYVGLKNFPRFRNNKILRCFAWAPQICRYIGYVINNRKTLNRDAKEGKKRRELFEGLKMFET